MSRQVGLKRPIELVDALVEARIEPDGEVRLHAVELRIDGLDALSHLYTKAVRSLVLTDGGRKSRVQGAFHLMHRDGGCRQLLVYDVHYLGQCLLLTERLVVQFDFKARRLRVHLIDPIMQQRDN